MVIDLRKLFQADGMTETHTGEVDFSGVDLGGVKPCCVPVKVRASLRGCAGAVDLTADIQYTVTMPCDRCAETVVREYDRTFNHTLVRESQEEDPGEFIPVPDEKLDLDILLLEDVLLDMPGQFLCKEDCKGLCPSCGQNWNEGPCKCGAPSMDPRWEALKQLL